MKSVQLSVNQLNIFVGGPIQYALGAKGFDQSLKNSIALVIEQLLFREYKVFSAHLVEKFGADTYLFTPDMVTQRDFAWMQSCDVFISILPGSKDGLPYRSDGTHVELGWASALGKPIIVLTHKHCVTQLSHLVQGLSQLTAVIITDIEEVLANEAYLTGLLCMLTSQD